MDAFVISSNFLFFKYIFKEFGDVRSCVILEFFHVAYGFSGCVSSCGSWAPECIGFRGGSVFVVCRFSCSMLCGVLAPQPGMKPISLPCKADSLPLVHQGSLSSIFNVSSNKLIYSFWFSFEYSFTESQSLLSIE